MPSTTHYRQGDIVLVTFPFTDLSSRKRRPALIISPDSLNATGQDLVLVALTSHLDEGVDNILLEDGDFDEGALPKKSMIKITKIFTIHRSLILKRLCRVKQKKLKEILQSIRDLFK